MKHNVYEQVTNRIIELLEQGVVPWKSPYLSTVGYPRNFATGKYYSGINIFLLAGLRYASSYFLTYLQAQELGGNVRKGERGAMVVKYGTYIKEAEGTDSEAAAEEERRYLKTYTVFNASQINGIDFPKPEALSEFTPSEKCDRARQIVAGMPQRPEIKEGFALAFYSPSSDTIHMPERSYFANDEAYHSTLFHELIHSTGHSSRLARRSLMENKGINVNGEARKVYAEEELVAEMGAAFLNAEAGILEAEVENSAAYLQGWIDALKFKDAKGWIVKVAGEAQKGAGFCLSNPSMNMRKDEIPCPHPGGLISLPLTKE